MNINIYWVLILMPGKRIKIDDNENKKALLKVSKEQSRSIVEDEECCSQHTQALFSQSYLLLITFLDIILQNTLFPIV